MVEDGTKNNSGSIPLDSAWVSWAIPSFFNSCHSFVEDGYWVSWACKSPCWHLLRWGHVVWVLDPSFCVVLHFWKPSFLALIFTSYFCIPLGIMRNTELLSCSNLRLRETCFGFAQSPKLGTPTMFWAAGNAMGTTLPPGAFLLCCWPPFLATIAPQTSWTQPGKWGKGGMNLRGYNGL